MSQIKSKSSLTYTNTDKSATHSKEYSLSLLKTMLLSREAEKRESILFRQGRGQFHLPSAGHEAIAGIAPLINKDDWLYCYYRDRALLLAMGMPLYDMALGYFGKAESSSGGRQMASHFSYKPLNVVSCATPTGMQCLPAAGTAWAFKNEQRKNVVFCCIGDASTRQGEFFEALAFSIQEKLPLIFIVEDNGYGVSTPTERMIPANLGMIPPDVLHIVEGQCPEKLYQKFSPIVENARNGNGPAVMWVKLDRIMSHTSSDDQAKYRNHTEMEEMKRRDPIALFKKKIAVNKLATVESIQTLEDEAKDEVKNIYSQAEHAENPDPKDIYAHRFSSINSSKRLENIQIQDGLASWSMAQSFNLTLDKLMQENSKTILFGQDIEDPKGGVFGLTRGLSGKFPTRVINSPLAEATIAGTASGLAMAGYLPIFELQFIDFIGTAFNQIVNQIATLRWRSVGQYKCPLIIYAPCGSYISGGGPWHSQTNESWLAHAPGLKVYMPSNANDAANMLYSAAHGDDPVLMLLPKNQFQKSVAIEKSMTLYPEKAQIKKKGEYLTIVSWGNCVEIALESAAAIEKSGLTCEVIDLRSIVPCDWATIHQSVRKTGRLIVVQEDNKTCSFGQAIISEMMSDKITWDSMYAPPQLVSRPDVHVGFNAGLERAVLPWPKDVFAASKILTGGAHV